MPLVFSTLPPSPSLKFKGRGRGMGYIIKAGFGER